MHKNKVKEEQFFEKALPQVWNQYEFLHRVLKNFESKFQMLLSLISIILLIFFSLGLHNQKENFIPLIGCFTSLVICFYFIIPKTYQVPWLEKDELNKIRKNDENICKYFYDDIFSCTKEIRRLEAKYKKGFIFASYIIQASICDMLFNYAYEKLINNLLIVFIIDIIIILLAIIVAYIQTKTK